MMWHKIMIDWTHLTGGVQLTIDLMNRTQQKTCHIYNILQLFNQFCNYSTKTNQKSTLCTK